MSNIKPRNPIAVAFNKKENEASKIERVVSNRLEKHCLSSEEDLKEYEQQLLKIADNPKSVEKIIAKRKQEFEERKIKRQEAKNPSYHYAPKKLSARQLAIMKNK